jgi:hypothetical protein
MPVEIEDGILVSAKTVAALRALFTWPPGGWVLDVPAKGDQRSGVVRVGLTDSHATWRCRAAAAPESSQDRFSSSGSLAMLAAMRRASSWVFLYRALP